MFYQLAVTLGPGAAYLIWYRRTKRPRAGGLMWCMAACFMIYIAAVIDVTGAGSLPSLFRYGIDLRAGAYYGLNLIPFSQEIDPMGYFLNVVMMTPMGFFLPVLGGGGLKKAVAGGFTMSLLIELSQLTNSRSTDVDDLICNTLGAAAGYLIYRLVIRVTGWKPRPVFMPMTMALAVFAGHFLLYDGMGMAGLIYGF